MNIGIDLGTANVLVHVDGKGIVITEPSVVAVDDDGRILALSIDHYSNGGCSPSWLPSPIIRKTSRFGAR